MQLDEFQALMARTYGSRDRERGIDATVAWLAEALASNPSALQALAAEDVVTTQSYQFTADIAAVGPHVRGYRRVKFVFDVSGGPPRVVYRQDLSRLGWALGPNVRETWLAKNTP